MNIANTYRQLTEEEISALISNGCQADDWHGVRVTDNFTAENIRNVFFQGDVRLGVFRETILLDGLFTVKCGIYNSRLRNCELGDDVYVENVSMLSGYQLAAHVIVRDVRRMIINGETSFGNGTEVCVMDETGGRKIPIYNKLSATLAYMTTFYRYNTDFIKSVQHLVADYVASITSKHGFVGEGSKIEGCNSIVNVRIGEGANVHGAALLENGSVNSTADAPVEISYGVVAKDFIVSCGTSILCNSHIERCFIGESCNVSNGFTAHDSLIFANSQLENGEACAIFAAPYTVSMHKSTLLIGGVFSFFNAGSNSNQSNHLYKLGPMHQGITERGVKFASGSYILWPAHIGAFTMVMGHHYGHPDTSDIPFSYLVEEAGESYLIPGVSLRSIGTLRDVEKWPTRDARKSIDPLDAISFDMLSPYTVGAMMRGRSILKDIQKNSKAVNGYFQYNGLKIHETSLKKGIDYYTLAIRIYLGERAAEPDSDIPCEKWVDAAGLIAPQAEIEHLAQAICIERNLNISKVHKKIFALQAGYESWCNEWCKGATFAEYGNGATHKFIVDEGNRAKITLYKALLTDAAKEFSPLATIGFGLDGHGDKDIISDIEEVRGTLEDNSLVCSLLEKIISLENRV